MFTVATETIERSGGDITPLNSAEEPYAIIPLHGKYGQGKVAKVSLVDAKWARRYRWYLSRENGYPVRYEKRGKSFVVLHMHRDLLQPPEGFIGEHKNRDRLDNRRSNIRVATQENNCWNMPKTTTNFRAVTKSRFKGVKLNLKSGTWNARITVSKKTHSLGGYRTEKDAARAYDVAARYYFGDYGQLNFDELGESLSAVEIRRQNETEQNFTSNYRGVYWNQKAGKWYARAYVTKDEGCYLGLFANERDAAKAVDDVLAVAGLARRNFPDDLTFQKELSPRLKKASKYRGVTLHKKSQKWYATVVIDGKTKHVGVAKSETEAALMADAARVANGQAPFNFPSA